MIKSIKFYFGVLSLLLTACEIEKYIDYEKYYDGDKIAVHAYLSSSRGMVASIHKTLPPDNPNGNDKLQDARLFLLSGGHRIAEATTENGEKYIIKANELCLSNDALYSIEVECSGFEVISSDAMRLPAEVKIDSLVSDELFCYLYINNPSASNGYSLTKHRFRHAKEQGRSSLYYLNPQYETLPAGVYQWNLAIDEYYDSICYDLFLYSPELIEMMDSRQAYNDSYDDVFAEYPNFIKSNIHGGYGLFATYSVSSATWRKYEVGE
ncbi:MAG: DUF4249 domain-containing protein [Bacteroidales bacterium]|nr:DUF4249 domain-containing protein [Bacteroidales bacterium]